MCNDSSWASLYVLFVWNPSKVALRYHCIQLCALPCTLSDGTKEEEHEPLWIPYLNSLGEVRAAGKWSGQGWAWMSLDCSWSLFREIRLNAMKSMWARPVVLKMDHSAWPLITSQYKAVNAWLLLLTAYLLSMIVSRWTYCIWFLGDVISCKIIFSVFFL